MRGGTNEEWDFGCVARFRTGEPFLGVDGRGTILSRIRESAVETETMKTLNGNDGLGSRTKGFGFRGLGLRI